MSRHYFFGSDHQNHYRVLMGWDRPLQQYFLVISKVAYEDEPLYSNLFEVEQPLPLAHYLSVVRAFGIQLPQEMIEELKQDGVNNVGDKDVCHSLIGNQYRREEKGVVAGV
jgi:hypothetical protein